MSDENPYASPLTKSEPDTRPKARLIRRFIRRFIAVYLVVLGIGPIVVTIQTIYPHAFVVEPAFKPGEIHPVWLIPLLAITPLSLFGARLFWRLPPATQS